MDLTLDSPVADILREVLDEMALPDVELAEYLPAFEGASIHTVAQLKRTEQSALKALKIPFGVQNRLRKRIEAIDEVLAALNAPVVGEPEALEDDTARVVDDWDNDLSMSMRSLGTGLSSDSLASPSQSQSGSYLGGALNRIRASPEWDGTQQDLSSPVNRRRMASQPELPRSRQISASGDDKSSPPMSMSPVSSRLASSNMSRTGSTGSWEDIAGSPVRPSLDGQGTPKTGSRKMLVVVKEAPESGTLEEFVECLCPDQGIPDWAYIQNFLVVYRYFTSPQTLLDHLMNKYKTTVISSDASKDEKKAGDTLHLRIVNILKKWIQQHFADFQNDKALLQSCVAYITTMISADYEQYASRLLYTLSERIGEDRTILPLIGASPPIEVVVSTMKKASSGLLADRVVHARKFKASIIGSEAVQWLVTNKVVATRADALALCQEMAKKGLVRGFGDNNDFQDAPNLFYCFPRRSSDPPEIVPPKSIHTKKSVNAVQKLLDMHPLEAARQLTLLEFERFKAIQPSEVKSQAWAKKNAKDLAPNVVGVTDLWNQHGCWVATELCSESSDSTRKDILKWFITFAEQLRDLRNYSALLGVISGMNFSSVSRLKTAWKSLNSKQTALFEEFTQLTMPLNNYKNYRSAIERVQPGTVPCLPYLAVFLKDLTFIEDGNKDYLDDAKKMINFTKMKMIAGVFLNIQRYQETPYNFVRVPQIIEYFERKRVVNPDQDQLYEMSLKVEPDTRRRTNTSLASSRSMSGTKLNEG